jgi:hypothetical protein
MRQMFREYRRHFEGQKLRMEAHYRQLLESSIKGDSRRPRMG